ncbi:hypothetical protein N8083_00990 [Candidatus Pacebacteria bacterium]|nr:hypothetical protein [Candidatus Paceibacterota bacterium]
MKRKLIIIALSIFIALSFLYLFVEYTTRGRVMGMYTFGGFKAPISEKINCAKETDKKVAEKFTRPLDFDEESKNALREYWHFSYYRACLFEAGYDFSGNKIPRSTIVTDTVPRYANYFGGIDFLVPNDTIIIEDNITNPDIEDRRISSHLQIGENDLTILVYRDFDDTDTFADLQKDFVSFSTSTGNVTEQVVVTSETGVSMLRIQQDDGLSGFALIGADGKIIQIFGENLPKELLRTIRLTTILLK